MSSLAGTQPQIGAQPNSSERVGIVEAAKSKYQEVKTQVIALKDRILSAPVIQEYKAARDAEGLNYSGAWGAYKNVMAFADYQVVKLADRVSGGKIKLGNENGFSGVKLESIKDYQNLLWNSGARVALFAATPYAQVAYSLYRTGRLAVTLASNREQIVTFAKEYFSNRGNKPFRLSEFAEDFHLKEVLVGATASAVMSIALQNAGVSMSATVAFAGITENLRRNKSVDNFTPEQKANFEKIEALFIGMRITNAGNGILHSHIITDWISQNVRAEQLLDLGVTTAHAEEGNESLILNPKSLNGITISPVVENEDVVSLKNLSIDDDIKITPESPIDIHPVTEPVNVRFQEYIVQSGDTLNKIAVQHGFINWKELAPFNNFVDPDSIKPGQTIRIPDHSAVEEIITAKDVVGVRINAGEDVPQIAERLHIEPETVRVLNPTLNIQPAQDDQIIIVPTNESQAELNQIRINPVVEHQQVESFVIRPESNVQSPIANSQLEQNQIEINPFDETVIETNDEVKQEINIVPAEQVVTNPIAETPKEEITIKPGQDEVHVAQQEVQPISHVRDTQEIKIEPIQEETRVDAQPIVETPDQVQRQTASFNPLEPAVANAEEPVKPEVNEIAPVETQNQVEVSPFKPEQNVPAQTELNFEKANVGGILKIVSDPENKFHSDNPGFWEQEERGELKSYTEQIPASIQQYIAPQFNHTLTAVAQDGRADSCIIFALNNGMVNDSSNTGAESYDPALIGELILGKVIDNPAFRDYLLNDAKYTPEHVDELMQMDRAGKISLLVHKALLFAYPDITGLKNEILGDFKYSYEIMPMANLTSSSSSSTSQAVTDYIQQVLADKGSVILDLNVFVTKEGDLAEHAVNVIGIESAHDGEPAKLIVIEANRWASRTDADGNIMLNKYLNANDESGRFGKFDATPIEGTESLLKIPLNEKNLGVINKIITLKHYEDAVPQG